ncbi:MAG: tetratricopeptide repeat protein [Symploca sp. SIO2D2]|nr:tetratricopeptide repeat protein [Symploca sp. SIO2D2]
MVQPKKPISFALTLMLTTLTWGSNSLLAIAKPTQANFIRSKHRLVRPTGRVERKREGSSRFNAITDNTELYPGDLIRPASGVRVRVLCNNGRTEPVPAGVTTGVNAICPPPRTRNPRRRIVRPRLVSPYIPYIISPRATLLLTEKPTLRWHDVTDANSFTVTVRGRGLSWTEEFSREQVCEDGICEVVYPGEPSLQPGVSYKLVIDADTNSSSTEDTTGGLGFKLIEPDEAEEVQASAQRIREQDLSNELMALALADLYAEYDLIAEAIETLERLEQEEKTAEVYRLLGELYQRIGLILEAEVQYLEAVKLAAENREELAAAKAGLGEIRYFRGAREEGVALLEEAKAIYQELEDLQRVSELEERLGELNS